MNPESFLPFILATIVILIIPGPTVILVISQALNHGRRSVVPLVLGVLLGDFTAMTLSLLGVGTILSASATLFSIFKWMGAIYLIYLGVKLWWTKEEDSAPGYDARNSKQKTSGLSLFQSSYIVTALNPKSIAFFIAFLPQFVNSQQPAFTQLTILGTTFLILATVNAALYAVFAGHLRRVIRRKLVRMWFNRCGGTALIGAGLVTAGLKPN